ncbi:cupin domain-containing protein, partial [Candidatus Latescibacterota bacterium]
MNAGADNPLTFYLVSEPTYEGFTPRTAITWHDEATSEYDVAGAHWCNANKFLIGRDDGQTTFQYVLDVRQFPYTMAQPHSHNAGFEEIWCTISGPGKTLLGKQLRDMPPGMAFKVPPDGKTPHAHINDSGETVRYFEFAIHGPDFDPRGANPPFSRLEGSYFNPERDIDADMFMGSWQENYPNRTHGNLIERDILTAGNSDPVKPDRAGAVLNTVNRFVYASLEPRDSTLP